MKQRGLRFTRYADDVLIFTRSEKAANQVMQSVSSLLERKLFLKVNTEKTKVVRPTRSKYLGFTFLKRSGEWKVKPTTEKKKKLKKKLSEYLNRGKAISRPLTITIKRVNEIYKVANSRLGWYKRSGMNVVNFIISVDLLENKIKGGAGLLNPLKYYLGKVGI